MLKYTDSPNYFYCEQYIKFSFVKKIIYRALKKLWWVFARIRKFFKWLLSKVAMLVLVTILGPVGQMIVRNVFLNGSILSDV